MSDHIIDHRDLNLAGDSDVVVMEATDEFHSSLRTTGAGLKSESTNACFHQSSSSIIARDEGGGGDNLNTMNIVSLVAVQQQQRKSPNARVPNVAAESPTRPHGSPSHPGQGTAKTFPLPLTSSSRYNRRQRCTSSVAEATNSLVQCSSFIGGSSSPNQQSSALSSVPTAYFNPQNFTMEYLSELLKDKKQLTSLPNMFVHLERLVEEEVCKVRAVLFGNSTVKDNLPLPDPIGDVVSLQEKVYVPVKEYPDYNFVGRILGPRGMTAKQLEQETGCKIMVRGRGSMRDKNREEANRNKPNWEHLNDDLHVLVQCEDAENRAKVKLQHAIDEIKRLLVPAAEGEDELKRKQLMELAIINGTYRPANQSKISLRKPFIRSTGLVIE
uniref:K Homology domain-containing protein n=1 Tax=Romanomermis culicivorax TaxID=13658 RepID=A0A915IKP2_ROMCU